MSGIVRLSVVHDGWGGELAGKIRVMSALLRSLVVTISRRYLIGERLVEVL
jgi:hypothetical protein